LTPADPLGPAALTWLVGRNHDRERGRRRDGQERGRAPMDHVVQSQEAVFAFLADPATHGGEAVKRVDTHAAVVFLAGARVFKVKRASRRWRSANAPAMPRSR
jgi:hypothetical protein